MDTPSLVTLPASPIAVPHPAAVFQEFLLDAAALGHAVQPTKEMAEADYEKIRLGPDYQAVVQLLNSEPDNRKVLLRGIHLTHFQKWMTGTSQAAIDIVKHGATDPEHLRNASFAAFKELERLRFRLCGGVLFESRATLDDALDQTDIGADIPALYFKLPYPLIYIRLGEGLRGFRVPFPTKLNGSDGFVDGAYLREEHIADGGRTIHLMATIRFPDSARPFSSAYNIMSILIRDEAVTVDHLLDQLFWREQLAANENAVAFLKALVFHLAKILLYLRSDRAEQQPVNERAEALARYKAAGLKKQAKMGRKVTRAYDRIILGQFGKETQRPHTTQSKSDLAAHWRRGHFRNQAHGQSLSLRKLIWVKPVLVNAEKVGDAVAKPKSYLVTNEQSMAHSPGDRA